MAVRLVTATGGALEPLEHDPRPGSTVLGKRLGIPGLRAWQVARLPQLWFCFERADRLDVFRLW